MIYTLVAFTIIGFIIGILFDIFRVLRKVFKTSNLITYIEDVLFWILTGMIIVYGLVTFSYGEIRLYTILMIITGVIIYYLCISKYIILINVKLLNGIKRIISNILKFFSKTSGK